MPELPSKPYVQPGEPLHDFLRSFWQRQIDTAELDTPDFRHPPLPLARIKKVMKSDPDVKMIAADAPVLFCKACEIFIGEITARAFIIADSNKRRTLSRADIAKALAKSDQFDFLIDIVPREEGVPGVPPHAAAGTPGAGGSAGQVAQVAPSGLGIAGGSTSGGAQSMVNMNTMGPGPAGGMVMGPGMGGPSVAGVRKREDLDLPTPTPMLPHQSHMRHHQSQPQQQPQHPHYTSHASHPSHISQHHHTLSHPHAHQHQLSDTRTIDLNLDVNVDDLDLESVAAGAGARERLDENDNEALDMPGIPVYAHQHHQQQPHMDSLT